MYSVFPNGTLRQHDPIPRITLDNAGEVCRLIESSTRYGIPPAIIIAVWSDKGLVKYLIDNDHVEETILQLKQAKQASEGNCQTKEQAMRDNKPTKLYEFRALIRCHVVVAADDHDAARKELEAWGYRAWIASGETDDPTDFELVDERSLLHGVDPESAAHVVVEGDSQTEGS